MGDINKPSWSYFLINKKGSCHEGVALVEYFRCASNRFPGNWRGELSAAAKLGEINEL